MAMASKHHVGPADAALCEAHPRLARGADYVQGARRLGDRRAGRAGRLGKPEQVVQRMQVGAVTIEGAAVVDVTGDQPPQLLAAQRANVRVAVVVPQEARVLLQRFGVRRLEAGVDDAGLEVAVDGVIEDAPLHEMLGFLAEIPQQARSLSSEEHTSELQYLMTT